MASVLCSVPISYLGSLSGSNKPRWVANGLLVMATGSLVYAIPHFASPFYNIFSTSQSAHGSDMLCHSEVNYAGTKILLGPFKNYVTRKGGVGYVTKALRRWMRGGSMKR